MPKITYIDHTGAEYHVEVETGQTVMQGAVGNNVPGIDADCGGQCACATCHVYIPEAWLAQVGSPGDQEAGMLEAATDTRSNSRLSCQIVVTDELEGLIVKLPEKQH